jgi:chromosome segregation ATPase
MRELEESYEQLSLELKEEKRERKEVEKQVKELKDQVRLIPLLSALVDRFT